MSQPAILAGSIALPVEAVDVEGLKKALSVFYEPMGAEEAVKVELYREEGDYLLVPRQYGLGLCRRHGIEYEDRTTMGAGAILEYAPEPRDYQSRVIDEIVFKFGSYYDFMFRARTGWGKTVGGLLVAHQLGVQTLVVVDQDNLKTQWAKALMELFNVEPENIGEIQGKRCDFEGMPVTIGMMQTLSQKEYPQEVYDAFGLVIVDEVHTAGAPTFSKVLMDFPAAYRLGVSATPKRRDGLQAALNHNLGKVRVYVADQHGKSSAIIKTVDSSYSWYSETSPKIGRYISEVAENAGRNLEIAQTVDDLYSQGRDTLVLSDRIEHLAALLDLCYYLGIPGDAMGLYTGYSPVYGYEKNPKPAKRPDDLVEYDGTQGYYTEVPKTPANPKGRQVWGPGYYYTPVHLTTKDKRVNKAEFERIKRDASVIFATYGMFSKGVDVPRLSAGIDATPRSQAEQTHGRILRVVEGKPEPVWVTFVDTMSARSCFSFSGRIPDYDRNNSVLYEQSENGELIEWQPDELRKALKYRIKALERAKIEPLPDGSYTAKTLGTQLPKGLAPERVISPPAPVEPQRSGYLRRARPAR